MSVSLRVPESFRPAGPAEPSWRPSAPRLPRVIREAERQNPVVASRDRRFRVWLVVADAVATLLALVISVNTFGDHHLSPGVLLGLPLVLLASKVRGLYDRDALLVRKTTIDEAPALLELAALSTAVVWLLDGAVLGASLGKSQAVVLWLSLAGLGLLGRRAARSVAARSVATERLLLIGDAGTYARVQHKLEAGAVNARLVGRLSLQRLSRTRSEERPVDEETLGTLIGDLDAHRVLIVPSQSDPLITAELVRAAKALGVRVSIVPNVFDVVGSSVVFDDLYGMTLLGVREFELSRSSRVAKRALDLTGALVGMVAIAPVLALLAVLIKLDTRGPVFFRQERVGRDGRRFKIYKFRTMVPDAEARKAALMERNEGNGHFKIADDPRITRAGRILRKTSLDELPQLLNVLRGEMSLVGPRPLIGSEDVTITGYDRRRLHLTPGMTGHWQIMGSSKVPMHEMVKIDYLYVATWTLFEDLKILARTLPYMLARRGM